MRKAENATTVEEPIPEEREQRYIYINVKMESLPVQHSSTCITSNRKGLSFSLLSSNVVFPVFSLHHPSLPVHGHNLPFDWHQPVKRNAGYHTSILLLSRYFFLAFYDFIVQLTVER